MKNCLYCSPQQLWNFILSYDDVSTAHRDQETLKLINIFIVQLVFYVICAEK